MKMSLIVLVPSRAQRIPMTMPQFVIGRDPRCQLRPTSPRISKRHCALTIRGDDLFLRDFGSTNGTFVNNRPVQGEIQLRHDDRLQVGPLSFAVCIEASPPVNRPTPRPPALKDEDSIGEMLLALNDEVMVSSCWENSPVTGDSTVMDIPIIKPAAKLNQGQGQNSKRNDNSSAVAKNILAKYLRRPR